MELPSPNPEINPEDYLQQLNQHERWLATYVYSLVNRSTDAEEILQDCKLVMWKHFGGFVAGTNFRAWARQIATHQILNYRRSEKRRPVSGLEEEFIQAIAQEIDRRSDELEDKAEVLQGCLRKLPEAHRAIVVWRYYEDCGVEQIAAKSERSVEAVYRLLSRIRKLLNDCVSQRMAQATKS